MCNDALMSQPPHVVLVHGAWHGAWCWAALQTELDRRGVPSLAVDLPGHGASLEPFGDLHGDAAAVRAVVDRIGAPVVLVGHSYGGGVITQAAAGAVNVAHLVYLTAFVIDVGDTVIGVAQAMPPVENSLGGAMVIADGSSTIDPARAADIFYGHCSAEVASAAIARLCPQPLATFAQPASVAAWKTIPSTYVRCTDDMAIHITHQDLMAAKCGAIETLDTDHSPFASMPSETADILVRIASGFGSST